MHSLLPLSRPHQLTPDWEALAILVLPLLLNIIAFTVAFGVYHLHTYWPSLETLDSHKVNKGS